MIKIDFENEFYTGEAPYKKYPFYTTLYIKLVSNKLSYTDDETKSLFYVYPLRFDNRKYYDENNRDTSLGRKANVSDAKDICLSVGDGWRLPNANELLISYVFHETLGERQPRVVFIMQGRTYTDGIKTGLVTTGLHPIMEVNRGKILLLIFHQVLHR